MTDGGSTTFLTEIPRVVVGGVVKIEVVAGDFVEHFRIRHGPCAAAGRRRPSFLTMKRDFQIGKTDIMAADEFGKFIQSAVSGFRQAACDEAVAGGNESGLHAEPPRDRVMMWIVKDKSADKQSTQARKTNQVRYLTEGQSAAVFEKMSGVNIFFRGRNHVGHPF